jgi:hypothetical protein
LLLATATLAACSDDGGSENDNEQITTISLAFTPPSGPALVAEFNDPDGDGGQSGASDPVSLAANTTYNLAVRFVNKLEDPPEEITNEVMDESNIHIVLFTGDAVVSPATQNTMGPITQAYADMDVNGVPIGLADTIMAKTGTGTMTVTLRHMPPEEPPQKAADSLAMCKAGGVSSLGGSTDATADFAVTVQ